MIWIVVGAGLGSAITALVARRRLGDPDLLTASGRPVTDADRRLVNQVIAIMSLASSSVCVIASLVVGESVAVIASGFYLVASVIWVARRGLPLGWWQAWSSTWRR